MKYLKSIFAAVLVCSIAQAAVIYPVDNARIADLNQDGKGDGAPLNTTDQNIGIADAAIAIPNNPDGINISRGIYIYELPTLAVDEVITKIEASWFLDGIMGAPPNLQAEVFFKDTGAVVKTDYEAAAVLSLQDFMTPASTRIRYTWDDDALIDAFNTAYANGDQYVVSV
ncbi:MAG: hypothetical protein WC959_09020 [Kiritimatiellales bacterium]